MAERTILAHCYGFERFPDGDVQPSARGQLQIQAVLELERQNAVDTVFIAGGFLWGTSSPSVASVMKKDLLAKGSGLNIVTCPHAFTTGEEVDYYLEESAERYWEGFTSLANSTHLFRIMHIYASRGVEANFISAEEIIKQDTSYRYYLEQIANSPVEKKFRWREEMAIFAYAHGLERFLDWFAKRTRNKEFRPDF